MSADLQSLEDRVSRLEVAAAPNTNRDWTVYFDGAPHDWVWLELEGNFDVEHGMHIKATGQDTCRINELSLSARRLVFHTMIHNSIEYIGFRMASPADVPVRRRADGAHIRGPNRD